VVNGQVRWRTLLDHLWAECFPELALVNLDKGSTARRRGLVLEILNQLGHRPTLSDEPDDLAELDRLIGTGPWASVALTQIRHRPLRALRYLMMDACKLVLLVQSRTPFLGLLPRDYPLSEIDIKTVERKGTR